MMARTRTLLAVLALAAVSGCGAGDRIWPVSTEGHDPVYLTWQSDPTTTMTVNWLTETGEIGDEIAYARRDDQAWRTVSGTHHPVPSTNLLVHTVELTDLEPGGDYRFRIAGGDTVRSFRTMPAEPGGPITFIAGGDVYKEVLDEAIYPIAASYDPLFALVGGDIVYDNGEPSRGQRWLDWLDVWNEHMVTSDGRLIPMVVAIGNHEVRSRFGGTPDEAPFFFSLFAWPGAAGYAALDFGDYLTIVALDSDHTNPIDGEQAAWLEQTLAERAHVAHLVVVYHVPAFPSHRSFNLKQSVLIREHWVPKFERYGVDVVFENHDHAYKRTPLIKDGTTHPDGVLYLGDGAWGARVRSVHPPRSTWYLDRAESVNHVIVTVIEGDTRRHEAVDDEGRVFDRYPE